MVTIWDLTSVIWSAVGGVSTPVSGDVQYIWAGWNDGYVTGSAYAPIADYANVNQIWGNWNAANAGLYANDLQGLAGIGAAQRDAAYEARLARELEGLKVAQLLRDEADKKAEALLLRHLSEEQRKTWRESRYFELIAKGGRYRLYKGWAGNVARIGADNRETDRYCIHPALMVPEADNLLAQKLMLEMEEERFLKVANRSAGRRAA